MKESIAPNPILIERLVDTLANDILPLTEHEVAKGNKIFGAALLRKSDYSTYLAWIIHEITGTPSPNSSAPPFPVANPVQSEIQPVFRSFTEFATGKGFGERIRRFMNSPG